MNDRASRPKLSRGPRVLITDDDVSLRVMLTSLCNRYGYTCDSAYDGVDALAKLRQSNYDLLLLDLMMPRLNGFELIREMKSLQDKPAVIIVTAQPIRADSRALLDSDIVHAIVEKPFDLDELLELMAETARLMHIARFGTEPLASGELPHD